jgi:hypothetical protein
MARMPGGALRAATSAANTHRSLSVLNDYENTTFKHVLLPVWVAAYRYNGKVYRFVVNGQTGEVVGVAPWSVWKIALLVLTIVLLIGGIVAATQTRSTSLDRPDSRSPRSLPRSSPPPPHAP